MSSQLLICPTPIGNLDDRTPRQLEALRNADIIACEDTRTTGKLLERLGITRTDGKPELISYHEHNAEARVPMLIARMEAGACVVLVSDAGTPTISDPGYRLVQRAHETGLKVSALPGPVAAMVALSASGLPSDRFMFEGFLPPKETACRARLEQLRALEMTVILYVSPHKIARTVELAREVYGDEHLVCLWRELTKVHEECFYGSLERAFVFLSEKDKIRGEFVMLLAPATRACGLLAEEALEARIVALLEQRVRTKKIRDQLSSQCALTSSELYAFIEETKAKHDL